MLYDDTQKLARGERSYGRVDLLFNNAGAAMPPRLNLRRRHRGTRVVKEEVDAPIGPLQIASYLSSKDM